MILVTISKEQFSQFYNKYGDVLLRFLLQFTADEARARKILDDAVWEILKEVFFPFSIGLGPFAKMLQVARRVALERLKSDPLYDPWSPFSPEPDFFPLTDPAITAFHRQVFYLRYYRDVTEAAIAERYNINVDDIKLTMRETLLGIRRALQTRNSQASR